MTQESAASAGLPEDVVVAIGEIAAADRLLVALDFDGVLAPFTLDPMAPRMLPASRSAIERLQLLPDTWIAYVSGRSLASLEEVTEAAPDALLVGSHGVETRLGRTDATTTLTASEQDELQRLRSAMMRIADDIDGVRVETKPAGVSVHVRGVPEPAARRALDAARRAAYEIDETMKVRDGKLVVEASVRDANKGDGIARLREHLSADAVFYAGDDVTDEDAFAVLGVGDLGIKVGPGDTRARCRIADCDDVSAVLALLADERSASRATPLA